MKARLFTLLSLIVAVALPVPGGASPTLAQVQQAAVAPDQDQVTADLQSAPMMAPARQGMMQADADHCW